MDTILDSAIVKLTALGVSYIVLATGIKKTADWIEDVASAQRRKDAYELIVSFDARRRVIALSRTFARSLRWVFGDEQWSLTCFKRVTIATLLAVSVGALLLVVYRPEEMSKGLAMTNPTEWSVEALSLVILLVFNYLSVWKSRLLASTAEFFSFRIHALVLLLLELLLSFAVVVLATSVTNVLLVLADVLFVDHPDFYPTLANPIVFAEINWRVMTLRGDIVPLWYLSAPSTWAAFIPAAIFTLFLLSRPLLRIAPVVGKGIAIVLGTFNVEEKPFKAIGGIAIVIFAFIYVVILAPLALLR